MKKLHFRLRASGVIVASKSWAVLLTLSVAALAPAENNTNAAVRFGIMSDIHQDIIPQAIRGVSNFIAAAQQEKADFIIQLGDFVQCRPENQPLITLWNSFPGAKYCVLGNHEMDRKSTQAQMVEFLGMPAPYYTFTAGPIRGIVLNGNDAGGSAKGYPRFIGETQLNWLKEQLAASRQPACIFIHQPFDGVNDTLGIQNAAAVRAVLEQAQAERPGSIIAVFSGHLHEDYSFTTNGITYVEINSASYYWLDKTYLPKDAKGGPVKYDKPLWAFVTVDLANGTVTLKGTAAEWTGKDPWKQGADETRIPHERVRPAISDRTFRFR
ncbi:MAG TPA: metallophosphoesterase, partial [Pontiellaceae bacterium]|nr:metallophosphoesterase [Pontiellaceae bacterium]